MAFTFETKLFTARTSSSEWNVIPILLIDEIIITAVKVLAVLVIAGEVFIVVIEIGIIFLRVIPRTGGTKILLYPVAGMPRFLNALTAVVISTPAHPAAPDFRAHHAPPIKMAASGPPHPVAAVGC
jgi:hypothetical protein